MNPRQRTYIRLYQDRGAAQNTVTALLEAGVNRDSIFHSGDLGWDDITNVSLSDLSLSPTLRETLLGGLKRNGVVIVVVPETDHYAIAEALLGECTDI